MKQHDSTLVDWEVITVWRRQCLETINKIPVYQEDIFEEFRGK